MFAKCLLACICIYVVVNIFLSQLIFIFLLFQLHYHTLPYANTKQTKKKQKLVEIRKLTRTYTLLTKREVKMVGYCPSSFFVFMDRDKVEFHKNANKL